MTRQTIDPTLITRLDLYFSIRLFTRTSRRFAEIFSNDYEMVMIFLVVVEACFQGILHLGGAPANSQAIEEIYLDSATIGVSIFGIGDAIGIPRETVRRKVKLLTDRGYLAVNPKNKNIYVPLTALFEPELSEVFRIYVGDIDQFIRTVQHYTQRPA